jgi:hypothetical protein
VGGLQSHLEGTAIEIAIAFAATPSTIVLSLCPTVFSLFQCIESKLCQWNSVTTSREVKVVLVSINMGGKIPMQIIGSQVKNNDNS